MNRGWLIVFFLFFFCFTFSFVCGCFVKWLKRDILNIRWGTWLWFWGNLNIWLLGWRHIHTGRTACTSRIRAVCATITTAAAITGTGCGACRGGRRWRCAHTIRVTTIVVDAAIVVIVVAITGGRHILCRNIHGIAQSLMLLKQTLQFVHTGFEVLL